MQNMFQIVGKTHSFLMYVKYLKIVCLKADY